MFTQRGRAVECPSCSEHFGFPFIADVTILPTKARRLNGGPLVLDEKRLVCAYCLQRGITTHLF